MKVASSYRVESRFKYSDVVKGVITGMAKNCRYAHGGEEMMKIDNVEKTGAAATIERVRPDTPPIAQTKARPF